MVEQVGKAKHTLKVEAYRLTSPPIAQAILDAHKRGVLVSIIIDKAQQSDKYTDATFFANAGLSVLIDPKHPIHHNKIVIVDDETVVAGSFNFSSNAELNAENLLIIEGKPVIAKAYVDNFADHRSHCMPYVSPSDRAAGQPKASR